jgi:hypothetical protein
VLLDEADRFSRTVQDSLTPPPEGHGSVVVRVLNYPRAFRPLASEDTIVLRQAATDITCADPAPQVVALPAPMGRERYPVDAQVVRFRFTVPFGDWRLDGPSSLVADVDERVIFTLTPGAPVAAHTVLAGRRALRTQHVLTNGDAIFHGVAVDAQR